MVESIIAIVVAGIFLDLVRRYFPELKEWLKSSMPTKVKTSLIIYLSQGGTCRDPMAKVITEKILHEKGMANPVRIEGKALGPISSDEVSFAARQVIKEMYNEDLLDNYKPETVTQEDLKKADLVLVMDRGLMARKILPTQKTYLFKEFFGEKGDIRDPWPDGRDDKALKRYNNCANEIRKVIENNIGNLVRAVSPKQA